MEETAYLARLFMSLTHCSVNKNEATGLVANPGAIRARCETTFPAKHLNDAEESRLGDAQRCRARRTAHPSMSFSIDKLRPKDHPILKQAPRVYWASR